MTVMFNATQTGAIPPRPVTIHRDGSSVVAFEGFGSVAVTGPRRAELAGMVSAVPLLLRQIAVVASMLRDRDGTASPYVADLEAALVDAGINPDAPFADEVPMMTPIATETTVDRFAFLLASIAGTLEKMADDRANFRAPVALKNALRDMAGTINATLRENGYEPKPGDTTTKGSAAEASAPADAA